MFASGKIMLFNPVWDSEVERIGYRKCSPAAYALYNLADACSIAGVVYLSVILLTWVNGSAWWATVFWLAGRLLFQISQMIVRRRSFTYDYDDDAAQWHGRNGMPQRYTLEDYKRDYPENG